MSTLTYVQGDITNVARESLIVQLTVQFPQNAIIIPHIVNDQGAWGAGVSGPIGRRWPAAEERYRLGFEQQAPIRLGESDFISTPHDDQRGRVVIANMCAQTLRRVQDDPNRPPIRYGALANAMNTVAVWANADGEPWAQIHAPRFGAGLAGGHWPTIEGLILELWVDRNIPVMIYDLEV